MNLTLFQACSFPHLMVSYLLYIQVTMSFLASMRQRGTKRQRFSPELYYPVPTALWVYWDCFFVFVFFYNSLSILRRYKWAAKDGPVVPSFAFGMTSILCGTDWQQVENMLSAQRFCCNSWPQVGRLLCWTDIRWLWRPFEYSELTISCLRVSSCLCNIIQLKLGLVLVANFTLCWH